MPLFYSQFIFVSLFIVVFSQTTTTTTTPLPPRTLSPSPSTCGYRTKRACMNGDPHYSTWDGAYYEYHGTCPYVFVETCNPIENPTTQNPIEDDATQNSNFEFSIKAKNKKLKPGNPIAVIDSVQFEIYGQKINMENLGALYINEQRQYYPYFYPDKTNPQITIRQNGLTKTIETKDEINMSFYGYTLCVTIPDCPRFYGNNILCGLGGNYDGNCTNDLVFENSTLVPNKNSGCYYGNSVSEWAKTFITTDYFNSNNTAADQCEQGIDSDPCDTTKSKESCKPISDAIKGIGAFKQCQGLGENDISRLFDTCATDACLAPDFLCKAFEDFAKLCQRTIKGIDWSDWRTEVGCPAMECPINSAFKSCVPSCQPSCNEPNGCTSSNQNCMEGCQCNEGYVIDNKKLPFGCIKKEECGCFNNNGDCVVFSKTTTTTTTPLPPRTLSPSPSTCGYRTKRACMNGDPHYSTWDGAYFEYHGTCPYVFVQTCNSIENPTTQNPIEDDATQNSNFEFSIKAKNKKLKPGNPISIIDSVQFEIYGQKINMENLGALYINEQRQYYPYFYPNITNPQITIRQNGLTKTIETKDEINMSFYGYTLCVTIPDCPRFYGNNILCGLGGNYDGNCTNDLVFENSTLVPNKNSGCYYGNSVSEWAKTFITTDYFNSNNTAADQCEQGIDSDPCDTTKSKESCKPISDAIKGIGAFKQCQGLGENDISRLFDTCATDACLAPDFLCKAFEDFAKLCQRTIKGIDWSDWRTEVGCPAMECPINSAFKSCVPSCQPSCNEPNGCTSSNQNCMEGCQCNEGYVIDNKKLPFGCIKKEECGCFNNNGGSYVPILSGITPLQSFGETNKKYFPQTSDCKLACSSETSFKCTGFLWPAEGGDCYIYDKMDLTIDIIRNKQNSYVLYVQVCDGQVAPSVGYCEFVQNLTSISPVTTINSISPGIAAETSCEQFCFAKYMGVNCDAYIVSNKQLSQCVLYSQVPSGLETGTSNLYVKTCKPPPVSCEYSTWGSWGACLSNCTQSRTRSVVSQATEGGAPCLDTEMIGSSSCTASPCVMTTTSAPIVGGGDTTTTTPNNGEITTTTTIASTISITTTTISGDNGGGGDTTTTKSGNGGLITSTTPKSGGQQNDGECVFSPWSSWTSCNAECLQIATRTLINGMATNCQEPDGSLSTELSQVCMGGLCLSGENGGNDPETTETTTAAPIVPETGCRFNDIDPQSRPSSFGFKAVGVQTSCATRCAAESSFKCEAYSTTGSGGPCILHGAIDSPTNVITMSSWYLQDLNCAVNKSADTSICGWQKVRGGINADATNANQWKSIGYAINADHCGTLCMMNHPMFKPNPCGAYAFTYDVPWGGSKDNCFMYSAINNPGTLDSTGTYDLYTQVCYANATSVSTISER